MRRLQRATVSRNADPHPHDGQAPRTRHCQRASEPSHNVLASTLLPRREFMEATFKATWEKSVKFNALLVRPKRFELLTPDS